MKIDTHENIIKAMMLLEMAGEEIPGHTSPYDRSDLIWSAHALIQQIDRTKDGNTDYMLPDFALELLAKIEVNCAIEDAKEAANEH